MNNDHTKAFKFCPGFMDKFNHEIECYSKTFDRLDKALKGEAPKVLGMYNRDYCMRLITPEQISDYATYLVKAFQNRLISPTIGDLEKLSVVYVQKLIKDSAYSPLEDTDIYGNYIDINAQGMSLDELITIIENEVFAQGAAYPGEIKMRREAILNDEFKTIENMKFAATMKNIIDNFEDIINKSCSYCNWEFMCRKFFGEYVEKFILFAIRFNMCTMIRMIQYLKPECTFETEKVEYMNRTITECCYTAFLKTNDYHHRNQLPFNCNMRDIVLQDATPFFKDTRSALTFITTDTRSPIAHYIRLHMTPNLRSTMMVDPSCLMKMFANCCHEYDREKEQRNNVMFHTDVNWLDKIAYGNNFLNGNWRRDGVGNHNFDSITNVMGMVYQMFNCRECTTNNELSDALIRITCMMNGIIDGYKNCDGSSGCGMANRDLIRDLLAVFGEIFTKLMLKLYYNNEKKYTVDNISDDTMIPAMLYEEFAVFQEAVEGGDSTQQAKQNAGTGNGTISIGGSDTKAGTNINDTAKLKNFINKISKWVTDIVSKFSKNFNENHKREIEYVSKHSELNTEIANAIDSGKFVPKLTDVPHYNVNFNTLISVNLVDVVNNYIAAINDKGVKQAKNVQNSDTLEEQMLPDGWYKQIQNAKDKKAVIENLTLFGQVEPVLKNGSLTSDFWNNDIVANIMNSGTAITKFNEDCTKKLNEATAIIKKEIDRIGTIQAGNEKAQNLNTEKITQLTNLSQALTRVYSTEFVTVVFNALQNKFFRNSYANYQSIVNGYQAQKKK